MLTTYWVNIISGFDVRKSCKLQVVCDFMNKVITHLTLLCLHCHCGSDKLHDKRIKLFFECVCVRACNRFFSYWNDTSLTSKLISLFAGAEMDTADLYVPQDSIRWVRIYSFVCAFLNEILNIIQRSQQWSQWSRIQLHTFKDFFCSS